MLEHLLERRAQAQQSPVGSELLGHGESETVDGTSGFQHKTCLDSPGQVTRLCRPWQASGIEVALLVVWPELRTTDTWLLVVEVAAISIAVTPVNVTWALALHRYKTGLDLRYEYLLKIEAGFPRLPTESVSCNGTS